MKTTVTTVISNAEDRCYRQVSKRCLFLRLKSSLTGTYENDGYNSYFIHWRSLSLSENNSLQPLFHTLKITVTDAYENDGYNSYFKRWRSLLQANLKTTVRTVISQLFHTLKITITGKLKTTVTTVISYTEDHYYRQIENDGYNSYFMHWRSLLQASWKRRLQQLFHTLKITMTGKLKTTFTTVILRVKDHYYRHIWKRRLQQLFQMLKITITGKSLKIKIK